MMKRNLPRNGFRRQYDLLNRKKAELLSALQPGWNVSARDPHVAEDDEAQVLHDEFISGHVNKIAYQQLRSIETALELLREGQYGKCFTCGASIPVKRLEAIPWAVQCVACAAESGLSDGAVPAPARPWAA